MTLRMALMMGGATVLALVACGEDETSTTGPAAGATTATTSGQGGGSAGAGQGGTGQGGAGQGGIGVGGMAAGGNGQGGGDRCAPCNAVLQGNARASALCTAGSPSSQDLFNALATCACGACSNSGCAGSLLCGGDQGTNDACLICANQNCGNELGACRGDT